MAFKDSPFMVTLRDRFHSAQTASAENRKEALIDKNFKNLQQWPQGIKDARENEGRPALTFDQLNPSIRQLCNQQRSSRPGIQINPVSDGADEATAEILQGLIRNIEQNTDAPASEAYAWAFEDAVSIGLGYWRLNTCYCSPEGFDQELVIERVLNPESVSVDPASIKPHQADAQWYILTQDFERKEYERRWPNSDLASLEDFTELGNQAPDWFPDEKIRVAEYWYLDYVTTKLAQLADGSIVDADQVPEGTQIVSTRTAESPQCRYALVNAVEILDGEKTKGRLWPSDTRPSRYLPFIPVMGEELFVDGQRIRRGIIRAARDPQRAYNFERSALTEGVALAKSPPWIADAEQVEPFRDLWESQASRNAAYLPYKSKSVDGSLVPPPQRNIANPPIEGIVVAINLNRQDLHAITGYYDQSDPSRKNADQSGRAILARQETSSTGHAHYLANFRAALVYSGKLLVHLIPAVYDRPGRIIRILGLEDQMRQVMLNQPFQQQTPKAPPQPVPPETFQPGMHQFYDLNVGRYDVTVTVGGSYSTRRQEAVDVGMKLMEVLPQQAPLIAPTVIEQMDGPGHAQIAKILKKATGQLDPSEGPDPRMLQMQLQQLGQRLQQATDIIKTDQVKQQATVEKARIEAQASIALQRMKDATSIAVAEINARAKGVVSQQEAIHEAIALAQQQQFESQQANMDRAHEAAMATVSQGQEQEGADLDRQHELMMSQQQAAQAQEAPEEQDVGV